MPLASKRQGYISIFAGEIFKVVELRNLGEDEVRWLLTDMRIIAKISVERKTFTFTGKMRQTLGRAGLHVAIRKGRSRKGREGGEEVQLEEEEGVY